MQVKRFLAADMRRALEMVRQELGPDAIILSSNRTKDGVEILTTKQAAPPLAQERAPSQALDSENDLNPVTSGQQRVEAIEQARQRQMATRAAQESADEFLRANQRVNAGIPRRTAVNDAMPMSAPKPGSAADRYGLKDLPESARAKSDQTELSQLQTEMAEMRLLLEEQLSQMLGAQGTPGTPVMASVGRRLERLGLPKEITTRVLHGCKRPDSLGHSWSDALATLSQQLPVDASDQVSRGGVYALVGPTGAGKTTTIGKLAARYVMEHGPREVALVTTDSHRIGAQDQLRALARILRVPVRVVDENNSLESVLFSLRRCRLVLVDTAGFNHGDPRLAEQMQTLAQQPQVTPLLVLSCNSHPQMLRASVHAYGGNALQGCIFTKLDETASLGEALGLAMQSGLPIVYTTDGQDIPRDIDVARAHTLVAKAAALLKSAPTAHARTGTETGWPKVAESV
ncbi:flagellar biosynthesis protein FlhF [Marinimicrobium sp. ABcell2]|uniref:flagellar biosynthesis protein FlhF n=1 Tax=Marinimicrobium sp. ABcell2 TaxID=3069751 RepID=UPI0027B65635|nr:flagellar biosynthesis protein FlhF [Marinimicrobium sp. ABcell2]MDQ2078079.1 flagellar biosynthesis protein FlhF [Marinimicrobium sp. ABcell2]